MLGGSMKKFVFKLEKTRAEKLYKIRKKNGCERNLAAVMQALILAKEHNETK